MLPMKGFLLPLVILVVLAGLVAAGCAKQESVSTGHGHAHAAPHGGSLVEVGAHRYNLEFRFDAARGVLQVWVLDVHAENFVRVPLREFTVAAWAGNQARELRFVAVPSVITGESIGDTSQFEAEAAWLGETRTFSGTVAELVIRGERFAGIQFTFP